MGLGPFYWPFRPRRYFFRTNPVVFFLTPGAREAQSNYGTLARAMVPRGLRRYFRKANPILDFSPYRSAGFDFRF